PAALAARASAAKVRAHGLATALDAVRVGAPPWLADELARAWTGHGPALPDTLDAAAAEPAPDAAALAAITTPAGVVGLVDDPVHPLAVAREWCARMPRAVLVTGTLAALGADPAVLGRAAVLGWLRARAGTARASPT
ncbi:MAG: alpha/beta hydrolase, partial [Pseudonocardia sp.]